MGSSPATGLMGSVWILAVCWWGTKWGGRCGGGGSFAGCGGWPRGPMKTEIVDALEISLGAGWTGSVNGSEDRGKGTEAGWLEPPRGWQEDFRVRGQAGQCDLCDASRTNLFGPRDPSLILASTSAPPSPSQLHLGNCLPTVCSQVGCGGCKPGPRAAVPTGS